MAFEQIDDDAVRSFKAASALAGRTVVGLSASQAGYVVQILPSTNARPHGLVGPIASVVQGQNVAVYERGNIVKAIAAASMGPGAEVGFASLGLASQAQGTRMQATVVQLGPVSGASGALVWSVGQSEDAANAGEIFSLYINPRQLSGLV